MGPDWDRWSDVDDSNAQALAEMPPLEDVLEEIPLSNEIDAGTSQLK